MPLIAAATFYSRTDLRNAIEGLREAGVPEEYVAVASRDVAGPFAVTVGEHAGVEPDRVTSILELFGGHSEMQPAVQPISAEAR
ncbi:hypothetical protein ACWPM1_02145 [Tsuneonella sp. HG249]